ncbi:MULTISPECIES: adenosylcobinamide-GDP ribazoletransferase [Acidiphilium]|uniref:adenosylcobinamide-GDP ribazoletransferase n=1 Tax=Acidiphilium TaxID=522 RepID=UPI00257B039D|nr:MULTISPECIES: adenosylcobinamide-GDP ribazoletransferase [Acidiphilium]HQT84263.1 adenosylcobinamide-GDP ribazoletransferase [Acidiphilium rubrum]
MNTAARQMAAAFGLLTRLPLGAALPAPAMVDYAASVWAYPVVGLAVGGIAGVVYALALWLGMAPWLAAGWALVVSVLATGGLHEDGLADSADGLGGGGTIARRLAIMRDSRIGSYGAIGLVLAVALRLAAIASIAGPWRVMAALMVAGAFGRAAMVVVQRRTAFARPDGLAASMGVIPAGPALLAEAIAVVAALVLVPFWAAVLAALLSGAAARLWARYVTARLGGHTGDTLGAIEIGTEILVLSLLASTWPGLR